MSIFKTSLFTLAICFSLTIQAQDAQIENKTNIDKKSYYEKRALEDAQYEQQFTTKTKAEEKAFWKAQKTYKKDLKRKDKKAYKAYLKGKKDAYVKHYQHCDNHCQHSDHYYSHASFYYYRYDTNYRRQPQPSTINTQIHVNTPGVSLGLL
ncbi:hypothetical protein [Formosa sp. PL04]|uniref:hypothetical protein n=1 Tax=Formosa sp. PL04 TaxID=3081755 RepID=UPI0029817AC4|nr:hypothetical protein [Formosa sp. PL04]MDW5287690.1 hypothetical protein [Formosa sp. PL04]